ncbi:MAG: anhydro-N-acetylmuramic acid kinase [Cyclobacteriaceae bacterium]|nr:anhydro-N-acetylmuramic acid kinase [Cyclobacteriaceae bacterium]
MPAASTYRLLGLMSGTSLDGLDIACVEFQLNKRWSFRVIDAATVSYPEKWERRLSTAHTLSGESLLALHGAYGRFLGEQCMAFMQRRKLRKIDAIASHGHTIFHQPDKQFTFQLGDGAAIHAMTGLPVIADFRSLDVQLGGEGAPLVPMGDRVLFASADICLNLGGIANLSMETKGKRKAFDLCFCNMALNHLSREVGMSFDGNGNLASKGNVVPKLLGQLSTAYELVRRKRRSLGREFFERAIQPLLDNPKLLLNDRLRTVCESVAEEIDEAISDKAMNLQMLTTGGGARNRFLIEVLRQRLSGKASVVLPSREIIDFKEAIIFAFLGLLRLRNEINVLSSVTRATQDSCSGAVYGSWRRDPQ